MLVSDPEAIARSAHELMAWADGYEPTNERVARHMRAFCRDVLDLLTAFHDEAHGRRAMQANYERAMAVMTSRGYVAHLAQFANANGATPNPFL